MASYNLAYMLQAAISNCPHARQASASSIEWIVPELINETNQESLKRQLIHGLMWDDSLLHQSLWPLCKVYSIQIDLLSWSCFASLAVTLTFFVQADLLLCINSLPPQQIVHGVRDLPPSSCQASRRMAPQLLLAPLVQEVITQSLLNLEQHSRLSLCMSICLTVLLNWSSWKTAQFMGSIANCVQYNWTRGVSCCG